MWAARLGTELHRRGERSRERPRRTLQGFPREPHALGLCLQLLPLRLQLHRQLLGLEEAALQRVPLSPAESHQTVEQVTQAVLPRRDGAELAPAAADSPIRR